MVRRSRKPSVVCVTPQGASQALHALHYAQHCDNLRIEIAAARVLDAYCQGRLIAAEDVADTTDFLSAAERAGGMKYDITPLEHGFRVSVVSEASDEEWPVDDFASLAEAHAFANGMRMIDALSLRAYLACFLPNTVKLHGDAQAARRRAVEDRAVAARALTSAEAMRR
jgi:hypothetical protein